VATGLALVTKFSTITLPPVLGAVVAAVVVTGGIFPPGRASANPRGTLRQRVQGAGISWLVILLVAILVVPFAYFFSGTSSWWTGVTTVLAHQGMGHRAFFLGSYSEEGWWSYFLVAFLIKTPVGSLLLIAAGLLLYRLGKPLKRHDALFLLLPPALLFAAASYGKINIGVRHILPIYPFLFVAASRLASWRPDRVVLRPILVGLPLLLTMISTLVWAVPHQLAYFNAIVGGPAGGVRCLSDSNIDWGQDLKGLGEYLKRQGNPMIYLSYFGNPPPSVYGIRYQYIPAYGYLLRPEIETLPEGLDRELLAISVYNLQGVHFADHDLYDWLRQRTPLARIGYSIYVYDITGDAESHFRLAQAYMKEGPWQLAPGELRKVLAVEPGNEEAALLLQFLSQVPQESRHPPGVPAPEQGAAAGRDPLVK
jgi:hypothetical protein